MIPLSLYVHMPWCIRKCPYCDFNSHESGGTLPQAQIDAYIQCLLHDLARDLPVAGQRQVRRSSWGAAHPVFSLLPTSAGCLGPLTT